MIFDPKEELDHIAEFADSGVRVFQRQGLLLLTIAGWCLNRLMGVPAPVWAAPARRFDTAFQLT